MNDLAHVLLILLQVAAGASLVIVVGTLIAVRCGCVLHMEYIEGDDIEDEYE